MKITRQIVADKIADYLHGKLSQAELVDWAERAMQISTKPIWTCCQILSAALGSLMLRNSDYAGKTAKSFSADWATARE